MKHCSDCGAELKRVSRKGYSPYRCCVSDICRDNYAVKKLEKRRTLCQSLPSGPSDALLRNIGGNN